MLFVVSLPKTATRSTAQFLKIERPIDKWINSWNRTQRGRGPEQFRVMLRSDQPNAALRCANYGQYAYEERRWREVFRSSK